MDSSPTNRALVLADAGQRKLPPDRPPAEGHDERKKKKKLEQLPQVIMDEAMSDKEPDQHFGELQNAESSKAEGKEEQSVPKFSSYRDSLLGFNGIAHSNHILEEEDLFANDKEVFWKIPEPTEEMKKLMETYPVAPCTEEEYNEWCEPWNYALILTVLGKKFNLYVLKDLLIKLWGFSNFELIDIPNNYFVVRFQDQELWRSHYRKVLYEGPWVIKQHCVLVQRWTPYFNPYQNEFGRIATWIRIPDVPMHLYNKHCISRLGDRIGRTLKVDMNTLQDGQNTAPKRGKFVRICVELNLQKKLVPNVIAAGSIFNVEYEGLTLICFPCGRFGHRREGCPHKGHVSDQQEETHAIHHPPQQPPTRLSVNTPVTNADEAFGPWMMATRRPSRARPLQRPDLRNGPLGSAAAMPSCSKPVRATVTAHKSRFAVIEDLEDSDSVPVLQAENSKDRADSTMKPSNLGRGREIAGILISKGNDFKNNKIHYRPKETKSAFPSGPNTPDCETGPITMLEDHPLEGNDLSNQKKHTNGPRNSDGSFGPDLALASLDVAGQSNALQVNINEGAKPNNDLGMEINKSKIATGPLILKNADSSKQHVETQDGKNNSNNAMILHLGPKKSIEKKAKNKNQRTHIVVQGSINTTAKDNISYVDFMAKEGHNAAADADVLLIPTILAGRLDMALKDQSVCRV